MLAGPGIKGATVKALVPFVAKLAEDLNDGSERKQHRYHMMKGLADYYNILASAGDLLSAAEIFRLDEAVYMCTASYVWLAAWAVRSGLVRYNIVSKHHYFCHLPDISANTVNPRLVSTYVEESLVAQGFRPEHVRGNVRRSGCMD